MRVIPHEVALLSEKMKTLQVSTSIKSSVWLCRLSVNEMRDFHLHTYSYFEHRIKEIEQNAKKAKRDKDSKEDAEFLVELKAHKNHGGYFAVLMMYSAFERALEELRDLTLDLAIAPQLRDVVSFAGQRKFSLEDYATFFERLGIGFHRAPYDWTGLTCLRDRRNAIVHQGGWVNEINYKRLSHYGHKIGERLNSVDFVGKAGRLIDRTVDQLGKDFLKVIRSKNLLNNQVE